MIRSNRDPERPRRGQEINVVSKDLRQVRTTLGVVSAAIFVFIGVPWTLTTRNPAELSAKTATAFGLDANWDDRFGTHGTNGIVRAIAAVGTTVYVGGTFTMAGGVPANSIAKFDQNTGVWSALGTGMVGGTNLGGAPATVAALAVDGSGNLYAGGDFVTAGGVPANRVARWNGSSWSALGNGVTVLGTGDPPVTTIAVSGANVYVGGSFTQVDGSVAANNIARFNGGTWSALGASPAGGGVGGGTGVPVATIIVDGLGDLYVGGSFTTAGGVAANRVAKFTLGSNSWSAVGSGFNNGSVNALLLVGTDLYAGGSFTTAGGSVGNRFARFASGSWAEVGGGVNSTVFALLQMGTQTFVGGSFTTAGGGAVAAPGLVVWNGSNFAALGSGLTGVSPQVRALATNGAVPFLGGLFTIVGSGSANNVGLWNGSAFVGLGTGPANGLDGQVLSIVRSGGDIFATGTFLTAGGVLVNRIAKWNGSSWSALGSGLDNVGRSLAASGNDVYVGGNFTSAGGVGATHVAKWNGVSWSALGSGVSFLVSAIAVDGNIVYAGGGGGSSGGVKIARWDGSGWTEIASGDGSGFPFAVMTMVVSGGQLYVGGEFTLIGGVSARNIAKWNNGTWSALATSMTGGFGFEGVAAIAVSGADVYAGGQFTNVDGVAANNIAKNTAGTWSALGSGVTGGFLPSVNALAFAGSTLFVGGQFTTAGGNAAASVAKWSGGTWSPLASGVHSTLAPNFPEAIEEDVSVRAMAVNAGSLYVGGDMIIAGGKASIAFGRWSFAEVGPEMTCNGNFSAGLNCWIAFGSTNNVQDQSVIQHNSAGNGQFEYWRQAPAPGNANQAVVFQETGVAIGAGVALEAQFDVGNSSSVRKRISVLILAHDFSDLTVCTFWLPPNSPLRTYGMRTHSTLAWANAAIYFYAASTGNDGGTYLLDNVSMHTNTGVSTERTDCLDPLVPVPPGGATGPNLLDNSDFSTPINPPTDWFIDGNLVSQLNAGVFEFYRVAPVLPAGVVAQPTDESLAAGEIITATLQLGNASSIRQRVTVILGSNDFSDLHACTFWLPSGQPLSTYIMRTYTTIAQPVHLLSVYSATVANNPWMRLDNVSLHRTPGTSALGSECIEPGGGSILSAGSTFTVGGAGGIAPRAGSDPTSVPERTLADATMTPLAPIVAGMDPSSSEWMATEGFALRADADVAGNGLGWRGAADANETHTLQWVRPIDLRGATRARLSFWSWLTQGASTGEVQASTDGVNWQPITTVGTGDTWTQADVDLSAFLGQVIEVRFVYRATAPQDSWMIDEIRIDHATGPPSARLAPATRPVIVPARAIQPRRQRN